MPTYHERQHAQAWMDELDMLKGKANRVAYQLGQLEALHLELKLEAERNPEDERAQRCYNKATVGLDLVRDLHHAYLERIDMLQTVVNEARRQRLGNT